MLNISTLLRLSMPFVFVGVFVAFTTSCTGAPSAPSSLGGGSSTLGSSGLRSPAITSDAPRDGSDTESGTSDGRTRTRDDVRKKIKYCRSVAEGDQRYERCQAFLEKVKRGGKSGSRGRGDGEARRIQYCKSLPKGHEDYERCRAFLETVKRGGKSGSRGRGDGEARRIKYCKSLPKGHEDYERCQAWLNSKNGETKRRQK